MGIGAYTTALLSSRLGVSFFSALPVSGLLAMVLGVLVALPSFRLKTVYLAMMTMAFAELVQWVLIQWKTVTLGTDGVSMPWPSISGFTLHRSEEHTSELQSLMRNSYAVFCLNKKIKKITR